jgi:DNA-binding transcriptional regulator YhcF (GntR family)
MMDRLFRKSKLYRDKWNEIHSGSGATYGTMTINSALAFVPNRWKPAKQLSERERKHLDLVERALKADTGNIFWKGTGGSTRKALLEAHHAIMKRSHLYYSASVRELAEEAGISINTVSKNNTKLEEEGWIVRIVKGNSEDGSIYTIRYPFYISFPTKADTRKHGESLHSISEYHNCDLRECTNSPCFASDNPLNDSNCDVWRWKGLGKTKFQTWKLLDIHVGRSVKELAALSNRHVNTVRDQLNALKSYGLAEKTKTGWFRCYSDADELATELGVAGTLWKQAYDHKAQRESYKEYLVYRRRYR